MANDNDDRKRPQLRLVVSNPDKRAPRPAKVDEQFIPLEELILQRDAQRPVFYRGMDRWQEKAYTGIEQFLAKKELPYALDPYHGKLVVLPAAAFFPQLIDLGGTPQDEVLIYVADDTTGKGLCLSLETILPFWSEDAAVMEETLLFAPIFQYGTLFLEENRHDTLLDLIYRLSFPLYPPALTSRLLDKFFDIAAFEMTETLQGLAEFPD